jgi:hypothetical protein
MAPELRRTPGNKGVIEVFWKREAEELTQADCHI